MAAGVASVWVPVEDMDRALAFYENVLTLQVTDRGPEWSQIDANGVMIGLNAHESAAGSGGGGAVITLQPDGGIEDEYRRLSEAGVEFSGEISEHPWGRIAAFADSEGNSLQLYAPPAESRAA